MDFSFWEWNSWFRNIDFTVIGSGITGLNCALRLKERFPAAHIVVVERGLLPNGASTKNAGFGCFGSLSEILDDLSSHTEEEVLKLVDKRRKGLDFLRKNLGDERIGFFQNGGYELFLQEEDELFEECLGKLEGINELLHPLFSGKVFEFSRNKFGFQHTKRELIFNRFEGQLDPGKMMSELLLKVHKAGVRVLNNMNIISYTEAGGKVALETADFTFNTKKLFITTNGFASDLGIPEVVPARAQVLITRPIDGLRLTGTFHLDRGYYYFRNVGNRILLGGGRNLDMEKERTTEAGLTALIQDKLENLLTHTIIPGKDYKIERRWSGTMGVGEVKKPMIRQLSDNVYCGVRLGGMGVAIGSQVGRELAELSD